MYLCIFFNVSCYSFDILLFFFKVFLKDYATSNRHILGQGSILSDTCTQLHTLWTKHVVSASTLWTYSRRVSFKMKSCLPSLWQPAFHSTLRFGRSETAVNIFEKLLLLKHNLTLSLYVQMDPAALHSGSTQDHSRLRRCLNVNWKRFRSPCSSAATYSSELFGWYFPFSQHTEYMFSAGLDALWL